MARLFGRDWTKAELLEHIGSIDQLGGAKRVSLVEGNTAGCEAVEFRTGAGLRFVVLPGRGLDISECDWAGESIAWRSQTGDVASAYFDPQGLNWLRSFYGGLLLTCGMSWAGAPLHRPGLRRGGLPQPVGGRVVEPDGSHRPPWPRLTHPGHQRLRGRRVAGR